MSALIAHMQTRLTTLKAEREQLHLEAVAKLAGYDALIAELHALLAFDAAPTPPITLPEVDAPADRDETTGCGMNGESKTPPRSTWIVGALRFLRLATPAALAGAAVGELL